MKVYTREDLAVLDLLERPIWVFDIEKSGIWWANRAALVLWRAEDLPSLLARDMSEDVSEASVQRVATYIHRIERGERIVEQWTIHPQGVPVPLLLRAGPIHIDNGRLALLAEATQVEKPFEDRASLRGITEHKRDQDRLEQAEAERRAKNEFLAGLIFELCPPVSAIHGMAELLDETALDDDQRGCVQAIQESSWRIIELVKDARDFARLCAGSLDIDNGRLALLAEAMVMEEPLEDRASLRGITEHKRDRDRLEHAKEVAEAASRAKSRSLLAVVHDMRKPLITTFGSVELLDGTALDDEQRTLLHIIRGSSESLLGLNEYLIKLSRLHTGNGDIADVSMGLDGMVHGLVGELTPHAQAKGLRLHAHRHPELPATLRGDPGPLQEILRHLLDNAVKFTNAGEVVLRALPAGKGEQGSDQRVHLRFEVEDTGPGIPAEHLERIFEVSPWLDGLLDPSTVRPHRGTGLSLAVCRVLAERMGGTIGVHSEPGMGSRFWLELPLRTAGIDGFDDDPESATARRILIVEDNPVNQALVRTVLKKLGHRTTVVANGRAALQAIEGEVFDLVLMDIQMPEMDGVEATRAIRARGIDADHLPIIALTANLTAESRPVYLDAGMNECIGKPFRAHDLAAAIDRWAAARRAEP